MQAVLILSGGSMSVVLNTLVYSLMLSIENVSGNARLPGTLSGNFCRICVSNVENSSAKPSHREHQSILDLELYWVTSKPTPFGLNLESDTDARNGFTGTTGAGGGSMIKQPDALAPMPGDKKNTNRQNALHPVTTRVYV